MNPKLRFPGYLEDWQSTLLGDIASFHKGKGISKSDIVADGIHFCIRYGELYTEYNEVIRNVVSKTNQPKEESVISEIGDVLIPASGETAIDMATACALPFDNIILGGDINVIRPKKREYSELIAYSLGNVKKIDLARVAQGNSVVHISGKHLSRIRVELPISDGEITSINRLLHSVDTKIKLVAKKKQALETYKKGLIQKIFSQELRFKQEDGTDYSNWRIETLDKLCLKCKSGGTPTSTIAEYYNGNIPFLAISDITEQGKYLRSTSKSISELGIENSASWIVPKQSLIYTMYASVGFVSINLIPLATSQAVLNLIVDDRICLTEYLYYWLYQFQKNVHVYVTTGTQGNLNAQTVKSFQVDLPSIKEQEKIILTLSKIDEQISLMNTQIENTVTLKKGLLQQMFV